MGVKLSIIVPVYRVETYLRKCVESLLAQDLSIEDYEIILVDDGSPDGCPAICDGYAKQQRNIKVIHQANRGLSTARNTGIEAAEGEYIQFVDSDDYVEPNVLKTLIEQVDSYNLDVLRFNYHNVNERYEVFEPYKVNKLYVDYSDTVCNGETFLTERLGFGCYACQFILRASLLNNCRFKEGIFFEDTEWTPRMLLKAGRVASSSLIVYNYLMRSGSITQSSDVIKKRKVLEDRLGLIDSLKTQMVDIADKRWFEGMIATTALTALGDISIYFWKERDIYIRRLKRTEIFPLSSYHSTPSAGRKIRLANISPSLLCMMLHCKNQ